MFEIRIKLQNNFDRNWGITRAKLCSMANTFPGSQSLHPVSCFSSNWLLPRTLSASVSRSSCLRSPGSLAISYTLPESTVPQVVWVRLCLLLTFIFWLLFSHLQLTFTDGFCIFLPHSFDTYLFLSFFPVMLGKMFLLLPKVHLYSWALCPIPSRLLTASDFYLLNSSWFFHISSLTACLNLSQHNLTISRLP